MTSKEIWVQEASTHNLKAVSCKIPKNTITIVTGVSGSGKSSLVFDTILAEARRKFFHTLSNYSRQFLSMGERPPVKKITGLSPAIAIAQNETQPSSRASVASFLNLTELLGISMARLGIGHCPKHLTPLGETTQEQMLEAIQKKFFGKKVLICTPGVEKKRGLYKDVLEKWKKKGFLRAYIDGQVVFIGKNEEDKLKKNEKHTIKLIVDGLEIQSGNTIRLTKSLLLALKLAEEEGPRYVEIIPLNEEGLPLANLGERYSDQNSCHYCGFRWPLLEARHFNPNSLGMCHGCQGRGYRTDEHEFCSPCQGTGIEKDMGHILFQGHTIQELHQWSLSELTEFFKGCQDENPIWQRLKPNLLKVLDNAQALGLGYLTLQRKLTSLSGGELQRLRLANLFSYQLTGVLYVLDEPSQGLHPHDMNTVWNSLVALKAKSSTILMVEHDLQFLKSADWLIDLGPQGGHLGGQILAAFAPKEAESWAHISPTAQSLKKENLNIHPLESPSKSKESFLTIENCRLHNLDIPKVQFLSQGLNVVTGVSGAGKTTLVMKILASQDFNSLENGSASLSVITRQPLPKRHGSLPATFLDVYTDIRSLFSQLPEAKWQALTARDFSLNVSGGRCENCKGTGMETLTMRFLPDAQISCPQCLGKRFKKTQESILYRGLSISQVLDLTLEESMDFFKNHKAICQKLAPALTIGLGYLKLGQSLASLSGGESQRLRIVSHLGKKSRLPRWILMDEPTQGLHEKDVEKLLEVFHSLKNQGDTLVLIEHHAGLILAADWITDLGPGAGAQGGRLMYQGPPQGLLASQSLTGYYLKGHSSPQGL